MDSIAIVEKAEYSKKKQQTQDSNTHTLQPTHGYVINSTATLPQKTLALVLFVTDFCFVRDFSNNSSQGGYKIHND